ncbi:MAG TPA: tyrosine-type recombinase/integrase [Candidatus Bathyarchaeia archaeon]|nr:tyrosine-type recombinase/integrase [Candidatus Bathyarchaeia archaeon]
MTNGISASVDAAHDKFIKYLKNKSRAQATILAYRKDIEQLTDFLKEKGISQVDTVLTEHIEEFKKDLLEKKYTAKSVSRKLNAVKTFFKFLEEEGITVKNPASSVSHPKYEIKAPRILSQMEYRAIRDAAREDIRISTIVELLLQTGMRIGELARLEIGEIESDYLDIKAYESHKSRKIPLNKAAKKALERYIKIRPKVRTRSLFITKSGRPFLIRNIRGAIERYFKIAGIESAKVNDLRHTFIAHQLAAGNSVVLIQRLVGHKRLSTTERYLDFVKGKSQEEIKIKEL